MEWMSRTYQPPVEFGGTECYEPSLNQMVRYYYGRHFDEETAENLYQKYFKALLHPKRGQEGYE